MVTRWKIIFPANRYIPHPHSSFLIPKSSWFSPTRKRYYPQVALDLERNMYYVYPRKINIRGHSRDIARVTAHNPAYFAMESLWWLKNFPIGFLYISLDPASTNILYSPSSPLFSSPLSTIGNLPCCSLIELIATSVTVKVCLITRTMGWCYCWERLLCTYPTMHLPVVFVKLSSTNLDISTGLLSMPDRNK